MRLGTGKGNRKEAVLATIDRKKEGNRGLLLTLPPLKRLEFHCPENGRRNGNNTTHGLVLNEIDGGKKGASLITFLPAGEKRMRRPLLTIITGEKEGGGRRDPVLHGMQRTRSGKKRRKKVEFDYFVQKRSDRDVSSQRGRGRNANV